MEPTGYDATKWRISCRFFINMERLRIVQLGEFYNFFGGESFLFRVKLLSNIEILKIFFFHHGQP